YADEYLTGLQSLCPQHLKCPYLCLLQARHSRCQYQQYHCPPQSRHCRRGCGELRYAAAPSASPLAQLASLPRAAQQPLVALVVPATPPLCAVLRWQSLSRQSPALPAARAALRASAALQKVPRSAARSVSSPSAPTTSPQAVA